MGKLTYFPLLMDRWVAGTREMTFEQKGFYIDLLVYLYDSGGAIKDAAHAARITGCDPRTSRRLLADLRQKFYRRSDGLRHKLVTEILKKGGKVNNLGRVENLTELRIDPDPDPEKKDSPSGSRKKVAPQSGSTAGANGTRLPEDWKPKREDWEWAMAEYPSVNVRKQLEVFRDHWRAAPGQKGRKANWNATWRNWIRRAAEMKRGGNGQRNMRDEELEAAAVTLGLPAKPGESTEAWHMRIRAAATRAH